MSFRSKDITLYPLPIAIHQYRLSCKKSLVWRQIFFPRIFTQTIEPAIANKVPSNAGLNAYLLNAKKRCMTVDGLQPPLGQRVQSGVSHR